MESSALAECGGAKRLPPRWLSSLGTQWRGVSKPSGMVNARTLGLDMPFGLLDRRVLAGRAPRNEVERCIETKRSWA
jgi:hypothetical protein